MKVGDLVLLRGSMWSSYGCEGEAGLLLETELVSKTTGIAYSRVLWGTDGDVKLYKTEHLEVISENKT